MDVAVYDDAVPGPKTASAGQWVTCCGVTCTWLAMLLSGIALMAPWWTRSVASYGEYPTVSQASLWIAATTTYTDMTASSHDFCDGPCDQTRRGSVRVITTCEEWDEVCSEARTACDAGAGAVPAPAPTRQGDVGRLSTTYAPTPPPSPQNPSATTVDPSDLVAPVPPDPPSFTLEPPTSTDPPTTTTHTSTTTTSTTCCITTTGTDPPTPMPGTTWALLRPYGCPLLTAEQVREGAWTDWEVNFQLELAVVDAIYAGMGKVIAKIPKQYFIQRPSQLGMVRMLWEVLVTRSRPGRWLGDFDKCPSAPAETLHSWLNEYAQRDILKLAEQEIRPRDWPVEPFEDWKLKEAWEYQVAGLLPTTTLERAVTERAVWTVRTTTEQPTAAPAPPSTQTTTLRVRFQDQQPMSIGTCQKSRFDRSPGEDGAPWYMEVEACSLVPSCHYLLAARSGVFIQMILGFAYGAPAMVAFIGLGPTRGISIPPMWGLYLTLGCFVCLVVAIFCVWMVETPESLDGPGFICTVLSLICSIFGFLFAAFATGLLTNIDNDEDVVLPAESPCFVLETQRTSGAQTETLRSIAWAEGGDPSADLKAFQEAETLAMQNFLTSGKIVSSSPKAFQSASSSRGFDSRGFVPNPQALSGSMFNSVQPRSARARMSQDNMRHARTLALEEGFMMAGPEHGSRGPLALSPGGSMGSLGSPMGSFMGTTGAWETRPRSSPWVDARQDPPRVSKVAPSVWNAPTNILDPDLRNLAARIKLPEVDSGPPQPRGQ